MLVRPEVVRRTEAPAKEPISLEDAKSYLRITSPDPDAMVAALLAAARDRAERRCERAWITQEFVAHLDGFWGGADLLLPYPPLQSVEAIKYLSDDVGTELTVATTVYEVDTTDEPGRIRLKPGQSWPTAYSRSRAVRIEFTAGYGDEPEDVPDSARHAVRLLLGHYDRNRAAVVTGTIATELPEAVEALLSTLWIPWAA